MDTILHTVAIYLVLLLLFALFGKRSLSEVTIFHLVILLIIAEVIGEGLLGEQSVTAAGLSLMTLLVMSWFLDTVALVRSAWTRCSTTPPRLWSSTGACSRSAPGPSTWTNMTSSSRRVRPKASKRLDQTKYAILERDGQISIISR